MAINIKTDFNDLIDESWCNILFAPETHLIIAEIEKFILPDSPVTRAELYGYF